MTDMPLRFDEEAAAFDITPWVDKVVADANAAMETAAKETVIQWLRLHGYTVFPPAGPNQIVDMDEDITARELAEHVLSTRCPATIFVESMANLRLDCRLPAGHGLTHIDSTTNARWVP